jgi:hypothetical protein
MVTPISYVSDALNEVGPVMASVPGPLLRSKLE